MFLVHINGDFCTIQCSVKLGSPFLLDINIPFSFMLFVFLCPILHTTPGVMVCCTPTCSVFTACPQTTTRPTITLALCCLGSRQSFILDRL